MNILQSPKRARLSLTARPLGVPSVWNTLNPFLRPLTPIHPSGLSADVSSRKPSLTPSKVGKVPSLVCIAPLALWASHIPALATWAVLGHVWQHVPLEYEIWEGRAWSCLAWSLMFNSLFTGEPNKVPILQLRTGTT